MSKPANFTVESMPDLSGKIAIVTGANSGLGLEVSKGLASKGAQVIMACRDLTKGEEAVQAIRKEQPAAKLELMALDLADLESVGRFAQEFAQRFSTLHILANNAGVMAIPYRQTKQGFEMQFGTNHLGHFALTGLLLPTILKTDKARIVTTSSFLHRSGKINFDDLAGKENYSPSKAYSQSKLANLLFAYELQHKLTSIGANAISVASHPGYSATNLQLVGPTMQGSSFRKNVTLFMNKVMAQSAAMGALPTLYGATAADVQGSEYFGPGGFMGMRGYPKKATSTELSHDKALAEKLWTVSEELTGVKYNSLLHA